MMPPGSVSPNSLRGSRPPRQPHRRRRERLGGRYGFGRHVSVHDFDASISRSSPTGLEPRPGRRRGPSTGASDRRRCRTPQAQLQEPQPFPEPLDVDPPVPPGDGDQRREEKQAFMDAIDDKPLASRAWQSSRQLHHGFPHRDDSQTPHRPDHGLPDKETGDAYCA